MKNDWDINPGEEDTLIVQGRKIIPEMEGLPLGDLRTFRVTFSKKNMTSLEKMIIEHNDSMKYKDEIIEHLKNENKSLRSGLLIVITLVTKMAKVIENMFSSIIKRIENILKDNPN